MRAKNKVLMASLSLSLMLGSIALADEATVATTTTPEATVTNTIATPDQPATQTTPTVLTAKDYIKTTFLPTELRGKYQGYQYSLQNLQPYHLEILQAEVVNGQDEAFVAQEEAEKSKAKKRLFGGLLKVASSVPFTPGVASFGSMGAFRAAAIASNVTNMAGDTLNAAAEGTTVSISNQYLRSFDNKIINPNQTFQFLTLVPKGPSPKLRVTFKNLETNQILDFEQ